MLSLTFLAASMTSALMAAIWQGVLLAAIAALCLRLIPALTAAARSAVWLTIAALAVVLPFAQAPSHLAFRTNALSQKSDWYLYIDSRWTFLIAVVWAVASLVRAVQLASGAVALRRLARTATPIVAPAISVALLANSRRAESRPVQLCSSTEVDRPCILGFFSPRILLPADLLATLSPAELHQVLLHELEHLRRRDDWTNLFGRLALVAFPLNPVLLWVERRLATERELACDDRVLEATGARKAYATCLAHLAEHTLVRRGVSLALALVGLQTAKPLRSELGRRVTRILTLPTRTLNPRISAALVTGVIALTTVGSVELAHSPQLVHFTAAPLSASTNIHTDTHFLPAAYHSRTSVSPFLRADAVLTSRRASSLNSLNAAPDVLHSRSSTGHRANHRSTTSPHTPLVRLTNFHFQAADRPAHLTLAVATHTHLSYRTVPVQADGWILVLLPVPDTRPSLTLEL